MKATKIFVLTAMLSVSLISCKEDKKKKEIKEETTPKTEVVTTKNTTISNDWKGTYFGTTPCASCPGINVLITLNEDGSYKKTTEYLGNDGTEKTTKGTITWNEDKTIFTTLDKTNYLVGENTLTILGKDKKPVTGELAKDYVLNRTELQLQPDDSEGYSLQQFVGDDKKEYNVIFNTNPKVPTALVQTEGFTKMLTQKEAWAKGGEYETNKIKLVAKGDKATLFIGDKKIVLTQK